MRLVITESGTSYLINMEGMKVKRTDGKPEQFDGEWLEIVAMQDVEVGKSLGMILKRPDGSTFIRRSTPVRVIHGLKK